MAKHIVLQACPEKNPNRPPLYPRTMSTMYMSCGSCVGRQRATVGFTKPEHILSANVMSNTIMSSMSSASLSLLFLKITTNNAMMTNDHENVLVTVYTTLSQKSESLPFSDSVSCWSKCMRSERDTLRVKKKNGAFVLIVYK